jgi:hypothetical protein
MLELKPVPKPIFDGIGGTNGGNSLAWAYCNGGGNEYGYDFIPCMIYILKMISDTEDFN